MTLHLHDERGFYFGFLLDTNVSISKTRTSQTNFDNLKCKCSETLFTVLILPLPLLLFLFLFVSSYRPIHWTYTMCVSVYICACMYSERCVCWTLASVFVSLVRLHSIRRLHAQSCDCMVKMVYIHVKYTAARTFCNEQMSERVNDWTDERNKTKPNKKWRRINLEKEERFSFVRWNTFICYTYICMWCASCYNTHSCWLLFILGSHFWTLNQEL